MEINFYLIKKFNIGRSIILYKIFPTLLNIISMKNWKIENIQNVYSHQEFDKIKKSALTDAK